MREQDFDAVVIGGGSAGMAAALRIAEAGHSVAIVEREGFLGGILMQCIHNGFGLHWFNEELTGPEFAEKLIEKVRASAKIEVFLDTTVMEIAHDRVTKSLTVCGPATGVRRLNAQTVVLAMGCRERNRGNLGIPGTRPSGIFTAGLAQRLINIEGYLPGRRVVVVGSGDIGLIMARRMTWAGAKVLGVIEILPHPSGLTRNIVQCLNDFGIPLYLNHIVTRIDGKDRVEGIEAAPFEGGAIMLEKAFHIECDTILLSVGLIPENELSKAAGVRIAPATGGPEVDARLMTSLPGVFACGNVLHVHDLVDWVAEEATRCGEEAVSYLEGIGLGRSQGRAVAGANVRYIVPNYYIAGEENRFSFRSLVVKDRGELVVRQDGVVRKRRILRKIKPAEMLHVTLSADELPLQREGAAPAQVEVSIE